MNLPDDLDQPQIRALTRGHRTVSPVVEATCRHAQYPACHRDRDLVRGEFPHYRVDHFGRTFSRAKYAAARLRISFSVSSRRFSRRSSTSSLRSSLVNPGLPPVSMSACDIQLRRHDSLIPKLSAPSRIEPVRTRASSTARCRNSSGRGAGTTTSFPGGHSASRSESVEPGEGQEPVCRPHGRMYVSHRAPEAVCGLHGPCAGPTGSPTDGSCAGRVYRMS